MNPLIRVNLLKTLGAEVGYLGEKIFASVFPRAARGEAVAILLEGIYSAGRVSRRAGALPRETGVGIFSRHVTSEWPIHKSWYVPVVENGEPAVYIDPPRGLVKYLGRDVEGSYAYLLQIGLEELKKYVFSGAPPTYLRGLDFFTKAEIEATSVLYDRLKGGDDFIALVIETLKDVDFLLEEGGVVYHVEVKTTATPHEAKLRKKRLLLQKRQWVLGRLGLRPALAVVVPRENWEVEIYLEKN
ncbi:hypothetical protein [Pyrobaculum aerophilum]|mgnify:CR=1 FL=1|uniref:Uncharacterized protein n=2 Tax=Pyrobaculum aerophilum TaxID=13773 RepID=Q8ZTH4_PYRAE|nr:MULTISPECIES: hypothetical protein [Pyrobaculum]AAL64787.1 hypothetical protein PAE3251 [Pyrobaculum aerophilum str. IM2]MCX8136298.1 hypothetical protein [Pyrobaculum aerophilum]RFA94500.1 hypothetical protein CGL51_10035 [Pyrobaculum aerophilum]RFA99214.1 hypothetical protein CGL52_04235 [Pyrobaculum aerophilum]HII47603.1 hypothetical protein [Pyrobaculum aerophilum]